MRGLLVTIGGFVGGFGALLRLSAHLGALSHDPCHRAPLGNCIGSVLGHSVSYTVLWVGAGILIGALGALLIATSLRTVFRLITFP